ncbi:hypothetical protein [Bacillus stratosphericus]|uniref:hypothetical protein n=1 Tax=Bacillus stratosphericus TaxID=293386 RepID=UPI001CF97968|nr:hypothetical protein [Bacillus stratosphericus]
MHSERRKGKCFKAERTITKTVRGKTYSISVICENICEAKRAENRAPETIDRYRRACRHLLDYAPHDWTVTYEVLTLTLLADSLRIYFTNGLHSPVISQKDEHKTPGLSPKSVKIILRRFGHPSDLRNTKKPFDFNGLEKFYP